jgi:type IV pilus modification protein PilV
MFIDYGFRVSNMKKIIKTQKTNKAQQGFTFLESLLALFVLSFGLLGVAGMHARSMQTGYVSAQRMAAVSLGEELIERIRANRMGRDSYSGGSTSNGCTIGDGSTTCTPTEMAADDLYIWETQVSDVFPTSIFNVTVNPLGDATLDPADVIRVVTISIDWTVRSVAYNYTTIAEVGP